MLRQISAGALRAGSHLIDRYQRVETAEAQSSWNAEYEATPATEPERFHILSGAIFPIYDKVMGSSGIQSVRIARAEPQTLGDVRLRFFGATDENLAESDICMSLREIAIEFERAFAFGDALSGALCP